LGWFALLTRQKTKKPRSAWSSESGLWILDLWPLKIMISLSYRQSHSPFRFDWQDHLPLTAAAFDFDSLLDQARQKAAAIATELSVPV
jgi:hypothetical protein